MRPVERLVGRVCADCDRIGYTLTATPIFSFASRLISSVQSGCTKFVASSRMETHVQVSGDTSVPGESVLSG